MRKIILACTATALVAGGTTATAASLITSKDIKDGTIQNRDIKRGAITANRLSKGVQAQLKRAGSTSSSALSQSPPAGRSGANGANGAQGPKGDKGDKGDPGTDANLPTAGKWGVIFRNTVGSPFVALGAGPGTPPHGTGSLSMMVAGADQPTGSEKAAFGNESGYTGDLESSFTDIRFWVWQTAEDISRGTPNMPGITFEIDPNLNTPATNYSSLVFMAPNSAANQWSEVNAVTTPAAASGSGWYLTGAAGNATGCKLSAPCTWAQIQTALNDGGDPATVLSVAVTKGRDFSWQGAIDALQLNDTVIDFEEHGVVERPAS